MSIKYGIPEDNLLKAQQSVNQLNRLIAQFGGINMPSWARQKAQALCDNALDLMKMSPIFPTELKILNGKSTYYSDPQRRKLEIEADTVNGLTPPNVEGAYSFALERLSRGADVTLLAEILAEILRQNPHIADLRGVSDVQAQYIKERNAHRQNLYSAGIRADWAKINDRFNETSNFYLDLEEYRVTPCILTTDGNLHEGFDSRPTEQTGIIYSFDKEYERNTAEWCNEILKARAMENMSYTNAKSLRWNIGCYAGRVETLYSNFKGMITQKIEDFKQRHGGDVTRVLLVKASDIQYKVLSEEIMLGYRIEFPSCPYNVALEAKPKKFWRR